MPSASLAEITAYLDQYLHITEVPDESGAVNGLQVMNASARVNRIVAAVDASQATIAGAGRDDGTTGEDGKTGEGGKTGEDGKTDVPAGQTLLLVHHGLFWDGNIALTGRRYRKVRTLLENDIALYSAHIPLDIHPAVGNNHVLARQLGLREIQPFDEYRGIAIGVQGVLEPEVPRDELVGRITSLLGTTPKLIAGGPETARRVGIITGGAGDRIRAAAAAGLDTYITGEGPHHTYFDATELGVNALFAGHYATETVGVKALAEHLSARFEVPWEFHDHPTGL